MVVLTSRSRGFMSVITSSLRTKSGSSSSGRGAQPPSNFTSASKTGRRLEYRLRPPYLHLPKPSIIDRLEQPDRLCRGRESSQNRTVRCEGGRVFMDDTFGCKKGAVSGAARRSIVLCAVVLLFDSWSQPRVAVTSRLLAGVAVL